MNEGNKVDASSFPPLVELGPLLHVVLVILDSGCHHEPCMHLE
jgi:hypothetical protein